MEDSKLVRTISFTVICLLYSAGNCGCSEYRWVGKRALLHQLEGSFLPMFSDVVWDYSTVHIIEFTGNQLSTA